MILIEGGDRLRFLNGQLTNDVRNADQGQCVHAALLNAKGQLDAVGHVRALPEAYLIDVPSGLCAVVLARLDRYLIADDVTLTDVSDRWHLYHLLGIDPGQLSFDLPAGALLQESDRFGTPGTDLLSPLPLTIPADLRIGDETMERFRIQQGVPLWPTELAPGLLPPEAGLDRTAISYTKGCYLGQEVISRMKRAGKTNRHLVQLQVPAGTLPGVFYDGDAPAGEITSVAPGTEDRSLALGFRKRKYEDRNLFTLSGGNTQIEVLHRLA